MSQPNQPPGFEEEPDESIPPILQPVPQPDPGPGEPLGFGAEPNGDAWYEGADGASVSGDALTWSPDAEVRMGFWGPVASGKTTFLAALFLAAENPRFGGTWTVNSADRKSREFQEELCDLLDDSRSFPESTVVPTGPRRWTFYGNTAVNPRKHDKKGVWKLTGKMRDTASRRSRPKFDLQLQDYPGAVFLKEPEGGLAVIQDRVIKHMAETDGFIYLYDPTRDFDLDEGTTRNIQSFKRMIDLLRLHIQETQPERLIDGRLPHHLSFCISKLDDPRIFTIAQGKGYVPVDNVGATYGVMNAANAENLFRLIGDRFPEGGAKRMYRQLLSDFVPGRVRYYGTSSIGFRIGPDGMVNPLDHLNYKTGSAPGSTVIRGQINPVNVLEPVIDLALRIKEFPPRGKGAVTSR